MTIDEIKSRRAKTARTRIPPLRQILTPSVIRRILHDVRYFGNARKREKKNDIL